MQKDEVKARLQYIIDNIKDTQVSEDNVVYIVDKEGEKLIKVHND